MKKYSDGMKEMYTKVMNIDGPTVPIDMFDGIFRYLQRVRFNDSQNFIISRRCDYDNSLRYIAIYLGYSSHSSITKMLKDIASITRNYINYTTITMDSPARYILNGIKIKWPAILNKNITVRDFISRIKSDGNDSLSINHSMITIALLKKFDFDFDLNRCDSKLRKLNDEVYLYRKLYNYFCRQYPLSQSLAHLIVANLKPAMRAMFRYNDEIRFIRIAELAFLSHMHCNVEKLINNKYFLQLLIDPYMIFHEKYFNYDNLECDNVDAVLVLLTSDTSGKIKLIMINRNKSLFELIKILVDIDSGSYNYTFTEGERCTLSTMLSDMRKANRKINRAARQYEKLLTEIKETL